MSDKLKEAIPNTIDTEKKGIENSLDNSEDKVALGILINIDKQVSQYDIDLAKDGNNYRFIVDNKVVLNIPFKINQLKEIGSILVKLFNNKIQLFGSLYGRSIAKDSFTLDLFENQYIKDKILGLSKNDIEEIFTFIMKVKKIKSENWKIESTICKNGITKKCKQKLGNRRK